jgi:WD40 repeat protein
LFVLCLLLAAGIVMALRRRPAQAEVLQADPVYEIVVLPEAGMLFGLQGLDEEPSPVKAVAIDLGSKTKSREWKLSGDRPNYAVSPDGKLLVEGSWPLANLAFWDVASQQQVERLESKCTALAFSPDGKTLAVCNSESLALWDPVTRKPHKVLETRQELLLEYLVFYDGGRRLLAANYDGRVTQWNIETGAQERTFSLQDPEMGSAFYAFVLSPDEQYLATTEQLNDAQQTLRVQLWELPKAGEPKSRWKKAGTTAIAFSPDSQLLAMGVPKEYSIQASTNPEGETLQLLRVPSGDLVAAFPVGKRHAPAYAAAFMPDGRQVIEISRLGVLLWDVPQK